MALILTTLMAAILADPRVTGTPSGPQTLGCGETLG